MLRLLWSVVLVFLWALPAQAQQDFLQPEEAFQLSVSKQADGQLRLHWDISQVTKRLAKSHLVLRSEAC